MNENDLKNLNNLNLVTSMVRECFRETTIDSMKANRRKFANGKLLRLYCDCSDNFEYSKLSKLIIEFNK